MSATGNYYGCLGILPEVNFPELSGNPACSTEPSVQKLNSTVKLYGNGKTCRTEALRMETKIKIGGLIFTGCSSCVLIWSLDILETM